MVQTIYDIIKAHGGELKVKSKEGEEIQFKPGGRIEQRAQAVLESAHAELERVAKVGLMTAIGEGVFADINRKPDGGKGHDGVVARAADYFNPFLQLLTPAEKPY